MSKNKPFKLDEINKKSPFKVPDNYFDDFAKNMQHQIEDEPHAIVIPFMTRIRPYLYVAASLLIIFSITFVALNTSEKEENVYAKKNSDSIITPSTQVASTSTVSDELVEDYYSLDDEELFNEVFDEEFDQI
ncbi:MAG: hypothetical protein JXQ69_08895 [Paludibacteraceae bacterium]|nr:hypothetical protein [Paludibacteraceae bacterium]